jgi:signal transduction histidine kinase/ActR/RegA family two-component response regulator
MVKIGSIANTLRRYTAVGLVWSSVSRSRRLTPGAYQYSNKSMSPRPLSSRGKDMSMTILRVDKTKPSSVSLSFKIVCLCVAATIGALTLTLGLFEWQDWSSDRTDLAREQLGYARGFGDAMGGAVERNDPAGGARAPVIFTHDNEIIAVTYVSSSGQRLAMAQPEARRIQLAPWNVTQPQAVYRLGRLEIHSPVVFAGRRTGEVILLASQDDIWRSLLRNLAVGFGLALISAALAGVAAGWLVKRFLRPLEELERAMGRVSKTKDFAIVVQSRSGDELGRLTGDFNALLAELNGYDGHLKQAMTDLTVARDAADQANVMKSEFLANMSHEIRTPLNGVLGMAQVMALSPLSEPQRERLEVIQKSGANLLSVLNDLLDLSKIEAGQMTLEQAPFDIEEVAAGAYSTFTSIANASGVSFSMVIDPEARGLWRGDSVRVRQVLYNLISNALKFTEEGEVRVSIGADATGPSGGLVISIADTGIGIAPEVLPKLFEKFVQADNSMTRRFGGTGLGLAICRHMVELMGGTISVGSMLGVGTTFRVALALPWLGPAEHVSPPVPACDTDDEAGCGFEGLRILAAEDNLTNQLVLKTVLHALGVEPVIVENGQLAVEAWSREQVDLILMDIQMPQMDGIAATREIRRLEAEAGLPRTPVVALSANAMKHQIAEYLAAGLDAHLAKPVQVEKLYATLLAVQAGEPLLEAASEAA